MKSQITEFASVCCPFAETYTNKFSIFTAKIIAYALHRTEFWKSQARKFCEFCNCSIADNKPSIQFHESGKKHKENVKKRLSEMQKKATKDAAANAKVEKQMKAMEQAAMKAYMKDIEDNPDFTSQIIKEKLESNKAENDSKGTSEGSSGELVHPPTKRKASTKKWIEAKTAEGHTYFWHNETGESVWETPKGGFISIAEQEQEPPKLKTHKEPKVKKVVSVSEMNRRIYSSEPKTVPSSAKPSNQPFGAWTAVVKQENHLPELDLPDAKPDVTPFIALPPEEKPKLFKERKVAMPSTEGTTEVAFKKRKFGGTRNARQRGEDD